MGAIWTNAKGTVHDDHDDDSGADAMTRQAARQQPGPVHFTRSGKRTRCGLEPSSFGKGDWSRRVVDKTAWPAIPDEHRCGVCNESGKAGKPRRAPTVTVAEPVKGGMAIICEAKLPDDVMAAFIKEARESGSRISDWLVTILCERYGIPD